MVLKNPNAEIIAIGSEFLHGNRTESNSIFLAEGLAKCGVEVQWKTQVGDDLDNIASVLAVAARRAKVVIVTGGLGSTVDDCTREAVAKVTGRPLRRRSKALQELKVRYAASGRTLTKTLSRQACIPKGAEMIGNPVGSAAGFLLDWKGALIIALPGVSREAQAMLETKVIPRLANWGSKVSVLQQKVLYTVGLTELQIDKQLQPIIQRFPSIQLSLLASTRGVTVVLREWVVSKKGQSKSGDLENIQNLVATFRQALEDSIYAEDDQTMEVVVGQQLKSSSLTLALAESCTGGLIGHRLTQVAGSSSYLDRGFICYSNHAKQDLLGVPKKVLQRYGAVSAPVAKAMAMGAWKQSQTDIGLSVTGIAGPGGGSVKKPVGLVFIGIDGPYGMYTKKFRFYGNRQEIKMRASQAALNILRLYLLSHSKK